MLCLIEVKSSGYKRHTSLDNFLRQVFKLYSQPESSLHQRPIKGRPRPIHPCLSDAIFVNGVRNRCISKRGCAVIRFTTQPLGLFIHEPHAIRCEIRAISCKNYARYSARIMRDSARFQKRRITSFKCHKLNQRISASVQGTPRRGNEHIAQGTALGMMKRCSAP